MENGLRLTLLSRNIPVAVVNSIMDAIACEAMSIADAYRFNMGGLHDSGAAAGPVAVLSSGTRIHIPKDILHYIIAWFHLSDVSRDHATLYTKLGNYVALRGSWWLRRMADTNGATLETAQHCALVLGDLLIEKLPNFVVQVIGDGTVQNEDDLDMQRIHLEIRLMKYGNAPLALRFSSVSDAEIAELQRQFERE